MTHQQIKLQCRFKHYAHMQLHELPTRYTVCSTFVMDKTLTDITDEVMMIDERPKTLIISGSC